MIITKNAAVLEQAKLVPYDDILSSLMILTFLFTFHDPKVKIKTTLIINNQKEEKLTEITINRDDSDITDDSLKNCNLRKNYRLFQFCCLVNSCGSSCCAVFLCSFRNIFV